MSNIKTCCVTGHRSIPAKQLGTVRQQLLHEILQAIQAGYINFIMGGAEGIDLIFGELVLELRDKGCPIMLEADIPYRKRLNSSNPTFQTVVRQCDVVNVVMEDYQKSCFYARNRDMVQKSSLVIAVYDGRESGGTAYTIRYARVLEREIKMILL